MDKLEVMDFCCACGFDFPQVREEVWRWSGESLLISEWRVFEAKWNADFKEAYNRPFWAEYMDKAYSEVLTAMRGQEIINNVWR